MYRKIFYCLIVITTVFSFLFSIVSCSDILNVPNLNSPVLSTPPEDDEPSTEEDMPDEDDTSTEVENPTDVKTEEDEATTEEETPTVDETTTEEENTETNNNLDNNEDVETPPLQNSRRVETPEWIRGLWRNQIDESGSNDMSFSEYTFTYLGKTLTEGVDNTKFIIQNSNSFKIEYIENGNTKYYEFQKEQGNSMIITKDGMEIGIVISYMQVV